MTILETKVEATGEEMAAEQTHSNLELRRVADRVERRDLHLWSIVILVTVVVMVGFVALIVPNLVWNLGTLQMNGRYLPQLVFGFILFVALFNIYVLQQRRLVASMRNELMRELVAKQAAEKLSLIDPLTEVYNRRYLNEVMKKDLSRAERSGAVLTFLMIDLDQFKAVNTRLGHIVGDRVLAEVANVLKRTFRAADTIIRYGGDEFLVMLDGCTDEQTGLAIGRLKTQVQEWNQERLIPGYVMKLSCGRAVFDKGAKIDEVLRRADEDMFVEKGKAVVI
jgi:diguanylate cyclase (GGDEF)-like protein